MPEPPGRPEHLVIAHDGRELSGVVREGESWLSAARRTCATTSSEPVPVDLSVRPLRWEIDHEHVVTVRAMTHGDLPLVTTWRARPHVAQWWHSQGATTLEAVTDKYGPDIDGMTATRMWVIEVNGRSVGFVQDYRIGDYPDYALLTPDPEAVGCDFLIGEPQWAGRGFGTRALWAWLLRTRRRLPEVTACFAAPDHRNRASLRILEKLGFVQGVWFDEPQADGSVTTVVGCTLDVRRVLG